MLLAAETSVSFSRAGKAVSVDTYLRPSTFGQLPSSGPIAYLPSVARTYSRPGLQHLFLRAPSQVFFRKEAHLVLINYVIYYYVGPPPARGSRSDLLINGGGA